MLAYAFQSDYRVILASSGEEAIKMAEEELPDTILLDIVMPDIDGYAVCRALRLSPITQTIPIIFSTSKTSTEEEVMGLNMGASDYITKPFNIPLVKARVRNQVLLKQKTDLLSRLASFDALTKIPNRRYFDEIFEQEWRRALRNQYPISIGLFDIDFFKQFNDTYGHIAGDDCLVQVARKLSSQNRRAGDFVARYGGEEFVFVWPHCPPQKAYSLGERARQAIERLNIKHEDSDVSDILTISGGIASVTPTPEMERVALIELADKMLYKAKKSGRNQSQHAELEV
ncbi:diguanylate cyclase [Alteromonas sp. a30]|nr:diguanylate cyclase [Alteromonas sp. a30]